MPEYVFDDLPRVAAGMPGPTRRQVRGYLLRGIGRFSTFQCPRTVSR